MTPTFWLPKSLDFFRTKSRIDILEGTMRSGKTTSLIFKFGLHVNASSAKQFFIAARDMVVARRNLLENQKGFLELFAEHVVRPRGNYNQVTFIDTKGRSKIIYLVGFGDKSRWEKILGSSSGGGIIDEVNLADMNFIYEIERSIVAADDFYIGATLNPDDPEKDIYQHFINKARPLRKYAATVPPEILKDLATATPLLGAVYWYYTFKDNPVMTAEKIAYAKSLYPEGSFYYLSKVLGLRGVVEGVIFAQYLSDRHLSRKSVELVNGTEQAIDEIENRVRLGQHHCYTVGVDLGNNETRKGTVLCLSGIRHRFAGVDVIDVVACESTEANALVLEIVDAIERWAHRLPEFRFKSVEVDGYGAVAVLMTSIRKELYRRGIRVRVKLCAKFDGINAKAGRYERMMLTLLLIHQGKLLFNSESRGALELLKNLKKLVYDKDGFVLDENKEENDYYDAFCYSITPHTLKLNDNIIEGDKL